MNKSTAKRLAKYHRFSRKELYDILSDALDKLPARYWKKPNKVNPIFDNGAYFNLCVGWVDYKKNVNGSQLAAIPVSMRVLEVFWRFSKTTLPKKPKRGKVKIQTSQNPKLL